jgi:hypothetical protein
MSVRGRAGHLARTTAVHGIVNPLRRLSLPVLSAC